MSYFDNSAHLMPPDLDDCSTSAPFLMLIMAAFGLLSSEAPSVSYAKQLGIDQQVRDLVTAVSAAGVRVRDYGLIKSDFDDNLRVYTAAEIWCFDLAIDVLAMLGSVDGLTPSTLAQFKSDVRRLDDEVNSHHWKHELKKAGAGLPQFQQLRQVVPHHTINPFRY